ncbi:MAG: 3-methyl-2-oxobutanoate hydroxymethyltransferase [Nitrospira sp.]|nr:3-methyl-2-oxobutanoate hydroxymethyltransferase [Nitrospira sp.]MBX3513143.1 3-methyl-2-oxobutanoate hydroxymethyltransferase [Xanthobacteraceae bacterium]MBX3521191.1 3-methyl-2-oxobutanoate hydroxymethyltransferase [Xanthobacteraceae bacterium]MCW5675388.1 3-methyl-2-oxobutanoate hydroxymethyltransferase [Xanthobacteraceae bacterium]
MTERKKVTIQQLQKMKAEGTRICALGVYDTPMAVAADRIGFELFVIGNSGPMSLLGYTESTAVRSEDLLFMCKAVKRAQPKAMIVATLPYMSYFGSKDRAIDTAAQFVREGADAVQCHADRNTSENIEVMTRAGVPVLAHIGLRSVRKTEQSGFRVQGRSATAADEIFEDALAMEKAGAFAVVAELVPTQLMGFLRKRLSLPVLSLGSGPDADGIYQVSADVVGFSVFPRPKTAAQFGNVRPLIGTAIEKFCSAVQAREFPAKADERCMPVAEKEALFQELKRA